MKILLTVGHSILQSGQCTSANGYVNEYEYNKKLAVHVKREVEELGHACKLVICPERIFKRAAEERIYKLNIANNEHFDLICELHLNSFNSKAQGTEAYYYPGDPLGKKIATDFCKKMEMLGFKNRSCKTKRLYIIYETKPTAILLETFFCDNELDYLRAKKTGYKNIAKCIASALTQDVKNTQKKECVMYYKDANYNVAKVISQVLNIPIFKDNGKDLPKSEYKNYNIKYVGDLGKDRRETCRLALNKYLKTNL